MLLLNCITITVRWFTALIYKYVKSPQLADDHTQEIFLKVWKNKAALTDRHAFKSFCLLYLETTH